MIKLTKWSSCPPWGDTEAKETRLETLDEFVARHKRLAPQDDLRLGQRFFNEFFRSPHGPRVTGDMQSWGELFYQSDDARALEMIRLYLGRLHYLPHEPPQKMGA